MTIQLQNVSFSYADRPFIESVIVTARKGEVSGIIGPNGSGKTTLLKLCAGILQPERGQILLNEKNIANMNRGDIAKIAAYIPSETETIFDYTAYEIAEMGRYVHKSPFESISVSDRKIIENSLERVGALEYADRNFMSLSSGEKQRVIIARALAQQVEWFLLDEPTVHLDIKYQFDIFKLLRELASEGKGILVVLHDISYAALFCDFITLVQNGKVLDSDTAHKIISGEKISGLFGVKFIKQNICGKEILFPEV